MLARAWQAGAGPGDAPLTIDLGSHHLRDHGLAKEGASVKGGEKVSHGGGGIVYHRHDEKELNWEPGEVRSISRIIAARAIGLFRVRLTDPLLRLLQRVAEAQIEAVRVRDHCRV